MGLLSSLGIATLCGDRCDRCQKPEDLFRFLICLRDPLAEIRVVDVKNCATLCADCVVSQKTEDFLQFLIYAHDLRRSRQVLRRSCAAKCALCEMAFGSCLVVCAPAFAIARSRVVPARKLKLLSTKVVGEARFRSSGWKVATFEYARSKLSQVRLENRSC